MTQSPNILRQILVKAEECQKSGQNCLAVFDLDSTLFDVSPRLQQILKEYAETPEHQRLFPEQIPLVAKARTARSDWGFKKALMRAGMDGEHPAFERHLKDFWGDRFFSHKYLDYDVPYEGAVEYVQKLHQLGCEIVYLTGRDVARMGKGTREVLEKWKFPLSSGGTKVTPVANPIYQGPLVLKPHLSMDDAQFKTDYFAALPSGHNTVVWFFENEPVNVNLVRDEHSHVEIVFFDSTHSGQANEPGDLPRILHYLLED